MTDRLAGTLITAALAVGALGGFLVWFVILGVQFHAP